MDKKILIVLSLLFSSFIYCKEECQNLQTHTFEGKPDSEFSFKAEIIKLDGLVIDIIYEKAVNDRIEIAPKESSIFQHDGNKHIQTSIDDLDEGWQDIYINVGTNILYIKCTSSEMTPVNFRSQSKIEKIKVAAKELWICEESCSTEKKIEKIIDNEDTFRITAFTTSENPITFDLSTPGEETAIRHFEMKPGNCSYKQKEETTRIPCEYINQGWNKLNIFLKRSTLVINNIEIPVYVSLKTISISGSYLVNCTKGTPEWKISNEEVPIPVFFGQEIVFSLTSTVDFSPVFNLAGNNLTLSWNNGLKFDSSGEPLHPNTYNIIFNATSKKLILYNENKLDVLMELKTEKAPENIRVSSAKGEYKIFLFIEDQFLGPKEPRSATTPPSLTDTPSMNSVHESPASNNIMIIVVVISLVTVITVVALFFGWKKINNNKIESDQKGNGDKDEIEILIVSSTSSSDSPSSSRSQSSLNSDMHELVDNIKSCNIDKIKKLVSSKKINAEDAIVEAHIRDNMEVVQAIMKMDNSQKISLENELIIMRVMEDLDSRINSVFTAIKNGKLYGSESADSLLKEHGLYGTIRDNDGNSLLHCLILSLQKLNQFQIYNEDNIRSFLSDRKFLVAGVNYKGQTPLHIIANIASKEHDIDQWENMANLLLSVGCETRVRDNNDQLPEDVALDRGCIYLQNILTQTRMTRGEMDMKSKIDQWPNLLKETKGNNLEEVTQLLIDNVPILPLSSTSDPLRVAIQRGYTEVTMLLLNAGAPLCGRTLVGLNALEVSHSTPGLTALLPALIRRELYNCLKSETELFSSNDSTWHMLKTAVLDLSETIRKDGFKNANWKFSFENSDISERSKEARKLLSLAASKGMGVTCQMLILENVFLHPLPLEISPDSNAKPNSLRILCRDLELSLSLKFGNVPPQLREENEDNDIKKLKHFCKNKSIDFHTLYDERSYDKRVLKYIAEQGLDAAYKSIFGRRNGKLIDVIIDDVTGFTMLHSAAYNGRMGMVEYLSLNNANENVKTKSGFSAAHVAAMRGHKECMEYILALSKLNQPMNNDLTPSGLTAHQISDGYASEIHNLSTFLLHESVSHSILSEPKFEQKARLVLNEKKSLVKECLSKESLDHIVPPGYISEYKIIWQQLKEESENFIQKLKDTDSRFSGKMINHHRNENALELLLMESYQIYLEIDNYEYWYEKNLHKEFIKSGYKALQSYISKSKNLCIVPPVFKPTMIGANMFVSYCSEQITTHISIHVIPVLKENLNLDIEGLQLSQMFKDTISQTSVTHIANIESGKWSFITADLEKQLFAKVDSSKLRVLYICRFIKKILYPHWWFPRIESRRHGRQWHHYAVSLQSVPDRLLISCFLWEIFNVPEEKWSNDDILERIIGVYEKMVVEDGNGKVIPSPNAHCFLDPGKTVLKVWPTITVIIDFLKELNL